MANYLGFIDETGVLYKDPTQRFFALGLLKCEDTSLLSEQLRILKNRAESKLDLARQNRGMPSKLGSFEFKFTNITKTSVEFYYELIDLYFKFKNLEFCSFVLDKQNPQINVEAVFPSTWDAYISYSKLLIKKNIKPEDRICVIADFLGKPKECSKFYEPEIRTVDSVFNATMLESHASLFIQLVDALIGCIVLDFRRTRQKDLRFDVYKSRVCDFLKEKVKCDCLARNFTIHQPNYFSVWEFKSGK